MRIADATPKGLIWARIVAKERNNFQKKITDGGENLGELLKQLLEKLSEEYLKWSSALIFEKLVEKETPGKNHEVTFGILEGTVFIFDFLTRPWKSLRRNFWGNLKVIPAGITKITSCPNKRLQTTNFNQVGTWRFPSSRLTSIKTVKLLIFQIN